MRRKRSPWNLGPFCATPRARQQWDWANDKRKRDEINAARKAAGLPPIRPRSEVGP